MFDGTSSMYRGYTMTPWVSLVLGMIAGYVLSMLLYGSTIIGSNPHPARTEVN